MENKRARFIAENLVALISPFCTRIEIAGSIRRGKADVKDIEIVAEPDLTPPPPPKLEFGKPIPKRYKTRLDESLDILREKGLFEFEKNGDKYKKLVMFEQHTRLINIDLFLVTPPALWGVQMVIRTGPAEFSHWVVTRRKNGGALPNDVHVQDGAVWAGEEPIVIGFDSELDFLNFLGLGWIDPDKREARWTK